MKKYQIAVLAIVIIIGLLFLPKVFKRNTDEIKFKIVQEDNIPDKIEEILPKYLMEERALTCKYKDEIYVVVTRGEKNSKGFEVNIDKIGMEKHNKTEFDIRVYAIFTDPDINEIVEQEYDYPYIVAKTNLKNMPEEVHLEVDYGN